MAMAQEAARVQALAPITVTGAGEDPDQTIVATQTATGEKLDTDLVDSSAAVSVVTQKELQTRGVNTIEQALSYSAGVSVDEYGSDNRYDYFRIRGFSQNAAGSYLDGLATRTLNFTGPKLEPYGLERIDILKGSTSTLFGLNAPGGLVNAISKRPTDYPMGEAYTTLGNDHAETGVDFGGPIDGAGIWRYRLTAKWQDANDGSKYQKDDRLYIAPAVTWAPSDATELTVLGQFQDNEGNSGNSLPVGTTLSPDTFFGEPDFSAMNRTQRSIGYQFRHDFGGGLTLRQNARYSNLDLLYQQAYLSAYSDTGRAAYQVEGKLTQRQIDTQLQYDRQWGRVAGRTLVGADYGDYEVNEQAFSGTAGAIDPRDPGYCGMACISLGSAVPTHIDMETKGVYLQQELTFDDRWILTLGGRKDWVDTDTGTDTSNTQDAFTKRVGLTYKATPDWSVYANYSESFEPVGAYYAGQLATARPQRGEQYEIGSKFRPEGMNALFTIAAFDLSQTNVARSNADFSISQVGQVDVRGLELEGRAELSDHFNLSLAYSYWDAEIKDGANAGNRPQLTPEHLVSLWADYTIAGNDTWGDLTLGGGLRYLGRRYADDANEASISSNVLVDAMASYQIDKQTEVALNVTNLMDREYVSTPSLDGTALFYGPEREVQVTLRRSW
ncbi:TonB-dependent siderophore receptor [Rhodobacteraceae bacterium]|nr:TonB-dependent siderophore receptor [Paracoccaceae bacterium]